MITLYHGTTESAARQIEECGFVEPGMYFGGITGVALTPRRDVAAEFGDVVFEFNVEESELVVDPESFDGDLVAALNCGASVYYIRGPLNL